MTHSSSPIPHHPSRPARILAIETSCDETAAAVVEGESTDSIRVLGNTIASQAAMHAEYGGVFPDLAAREHTKRIVPVIGLALHEAGLLDDPNARGGAIQEALAAIDAIAVTVGPGLIGPLLIGTSAAAQLANLTKKPIVPVNHWEGHLYSAFLPKAESNEERGMGNGSNSSLITHHSSPKFPLLLLTVSGGHTSLILMRDHFNYEVLGSTIDDAAGEAFDKCARMLGLGYPGGPALSREAARARVKREEKRVKGHDASLPTPHSSLKLPRPMLRSGDLRMSFSGLKTAVRYAIDRGEIDPNDPSLLTPHSSPASRSEAAREIEDAIVDVLLSKLQQAAEQVKPASIAIVGGVSANAELRRRAAEQFTHHPLLIPHLSYTTDNAAMIGAAGLVHFLKDHNVTTWHHLHANASLRLS